MAEAATISRNIAQGHDRTLTVLEVAKMLSVSQRWVYDAAASKRLPSFKVGSFLRFSEREMAEWLQAHRTEARA